MVRAYAALAEDGRLGDLIWYDGQPLTPPVRVLSPDTARLVTSFLADPMARLPTFPRYGPTEYPFPVALKTGTSQGYRDAWTVAWSQRYLVGVWLGRGDAGTMTQLSGVGSAARLTHAIMLALHGSHPGDLEDANFPPPAGRVAVELCVIGGKRSGGRCGPTLTEWVRPDDMPPVEDSAVREPHPQGERLAMTIPAAHRAWARQEGYPVAEAEPAMEAARIAITSPENNSRIWRNPETPPTLARLALRAVVEPRVDQVVWYVDGEPFAMSDPDKPVLWPVTPGAHRFQVRLPLRPDGSHPVRIVVE
jgi:penicillin-binding protein 1C